MISIRRIKKYIEKKILILQGRDSKTYIKKLKRLGVRIGENTVFYDPKSTVVDTTRPWMIEIGENVKITKGVTILTHGYDWSVLRYKYDGQVLGSAGKVSIGNNVFIGVNTTILKGVNIGNNVIIGANSLINKNIPDNCVIAGNPAKVIMSLDEYYTKRIGEYLGELEKMTVEYIKVYNKIPPINIFNEFFYVFMPRDIDINKYDGLSFFHDEDDRDDIKRYFLNSKPIYKNYNEFINACLLKYNINYID